MIKMVKKQLLGFIFLLLLLLLLPSLIAKEDLSLNQEIIEISEKELEAFMKQVPGLSANERINIYAIRSNGSQKVWGVAIENKKVKEIVSVELSNPTFRAEITEQTLKGILQAKDQINEALLALKNKEIKVSSENLKGKVKLAVARVLLLFIKPEEEPSLPQIESTSLRHIEDLDVDATLIEPTPSEREELIIIALGMPAACNPHDLELGYGSMDWRAGRYSNTTIAAPHGTFDDSTDALLLKIIARYSANYVIARGYETNSIRLNVNRPSERLSDGTERQTTRATRVYNVFKNCVDQYNQKRYIEIHGNSNPDTADQIQVATVNITPALARYLVARFNVHKQGKLDDYELRIEPLHNLVWTAAQNKQIGMLSHCNNICLHFEAPRALRDDSESISKTAEVLAALFEDLENYPPQKRTSKS